MVWSVLFTWINCMWSLMSPLAVGNIEHASVLFLGYFAQIAITQGVAKGPTAMVVRAQASSKRSPGSSSSAAVKHLEKEFKDTDIHSKLGRNLVNIYVPGFVAHWITVVFVTYFHVSDWPMTTMTRLLTGSKGLQLFDWLSGWATNLRTGQQVTGWQFHSFFKNISLLFGLFVFWKACLTLLDLYLNKKKIQAKFVSPHSDSWPGSLLAEADWSKRRPWDLDAWRTCVWCNGIDKRLGQVVLTIVLLDLSLIWCLGIFLFH